MNIKKTRKIFGIVMLLVVATLLILTFLMPGNMRMWEALAVFLMMSFVGAYIFRLKESPETRKYGEKLEGEVISGMKRGRIIGLILGLILIIYLVILMPTISGKLIVGVGSLIFGLIFYYIRK